MAEESIQTSSPHSGLGGVQNWAQKLSNVRIGIFSAWIVLNLLVIIASFCVDIFISNPKADSNSYLGTANNIIHSFRFFPSTPITTYPLGYSIFISPAMLFDTAKIRFAAIFLIQLAWVNVLALTLFRALRRRYSELSSALLCATVIMSPGIFALFFDVYSETIYTILICLALLCLDRAWYRKTGWIWFLMGLLTSLTALTRVAGVLFGLGFAMSFAFHLLRYPGHRLGRLLSTVAGLIAGLSPIFLQKLSFKIYPDAIHSFQYSTMVDRYTSSLTHALSSWGDFEAHFVPATLHQFMLLVFLSLGCIFPLIALLPRSIRSLRRPNLDSALASALGAYVAGMTYIFLQLTQSIVHVLFYYDAKWPYDAMARYVFPAATLALLLTFLHGRKLGLFELMQSRKTRWAMLTIFSVLSLLLVFRYPFEGGMSRLYHFRSLWRFGHLGYTPTLVIAFTIFFGLSWFQKRLRLFSFAIAAFVFFFSSDALYFLEKAKTPDADRDAVEAFYQRPIFHTGETNKIVYVIASAESLSSWAELVLTELALKGDFRYETLSLVEFQRLSRNDLSKALVFSSGIDTPAGCEKKDEWQEVNVYSCKD